MPIMIKTTKMEMDKKINQDRTRKSIACSFIVHRVSDMICSPMCSHTVPISWEHSICP